MVHAHSDRVVTTVADDELNTSLASHLARFHAGLKDISPENWHVHLVFPWSRTTSDHDLPEKPADDFLDCSHGNLLQQYVVANLNPLKSSMVLAADFGFHTRLPASVVKPSRPYVNALSERLSVVSLGAIIGVALC